MLGQLKRIVPHSNWRSLPSFTNEAILYPFLIAAFSILALLAHNIDQIRPSFALRSLVVTLVATAIAMLALRFVFGDWRRAALMSSLGIVLFFSYGHFYNLLKAVNLQWIVLGRHRHLLPVWAVILALGFLGIRRLGNRYPSTARLNLVAGIACCLSMVQIAAFLVQSTEAAVRVPNSSSTGCQLQIQDSGLPDIYLVILDAYTRDNVLLEMHDYDNSPFLNRMGEMGFYAARGSLSNYAHTEMTLSSMLNLNYVQAFPEAFDPNSRNRMGLVRLILDSEARRQLECLGYKTVAFESGVFWTQWEDADIFLAQNSGSLYELEAFGRLSDFEAMLIGTTLGRALTDAANVLPSFLVPDVSGPRVDHRNRILFVFDRLDSVPKIEGPKFVFAHIISPHRPFVFGPDGEWVDHDEIIAARAEEGELDPELKAYADQVAYLNTRVEQVAEEILAQSSSPPIIIFQGDHGWADRNPTDKLSILNLYHLPGEGAERLYPTISPINSLRIIFDTYFGGNYGLLEDIHYFSSNDSLYDFEVVPNLWESSETSSRGMDG